MTVNSWARVVTKRTPPLFESNVVRHMICFLYYKPPLNIISITEVSYHRYRLVVLCIAVINRGLSSRPWFDLSEFVRHKLSVFEFCTNQMLACKGENGVNWGNTSGYSLPEE